MLQGGGATKWIIKERALTKYPEEEEGDEKSQAAYDYGDGSDYGYTDVKMDTWAWTREEPWQMKPC